MTAEPTSPLPDRVVKSIEIDVSAEHVWHALTDPSRVTAWMSDDEMSLATTWEPGSAIVFRGRLHGKIPFENSGTVLAFEPARVLRYSHYSSLSRRALPDTPEHHVILEFALSPCARGTSLVLTLSNLVDYAVYGHLNFYWEMTLDVLKRYCETGTTAARAH